MIKWLKAKLDRAIENEAFRSLHEQIELKDKQLGFARKENQQLREDINVKPFKHITTLEEELAELRRELKLARSEACRERSLKQQKIKQIAALQGQLEIAQNHNQTLETHKRNAKARAEKQRLRDNRLLTSLRDEVGDELFLSLAHAANEVPADAPDPSA